MSSRWKIIQIKDLGRIVTGKTPPTARADFFGGTIPFLTPTDMLEGRRTVTTARTLTTAGLATVKNCLVPKGIAVSCIGWQMGKAVLVTTPTVTNQQINTVVVDESKFDIRFVYYLLSSMRAKIFELGATPTRTPIVNKTTFGEISVPIPLLTEQRQIGEFCTAHDDRIALLRETNKTLESIAQAIFKSWFVDFDPVRAKLEGRQPEGMDEETAALFPVSFDDSAWGPIPHGWEISTLSKSCSELKRGISPKYVEDRGVLVLNQKCVRDFAIDFAKARRHDIAQRKVEGRTVELGDVLVNSTGVGTLGRVAQVLDLPEVTIVDSHLTMIRGGPSLKPTYLGEWMQRSQPIIEAMGEGTTGQTELSRSKLGELRILLPPEHVQERFDQLIKPLKSRIVANRRTETNLAELRDSLLPRLVSGRLRLPEAKERVESSSQ